MPESLNDSNTYAGHDPVSPLGYVLVLLAGTFWSFGGLVVRGIETANEWQLLFYRAVSLSTVLLLYLLIRKGIRAAVAFRNSGLAGVTGGLCMTVSSLLFIFSITHTTVANTLFLLSTSPFMTALLARIFIGEKVRRATWLAMSGAVIGVMLMVGEGIAREGLFGDLTALGASLGFSGFSIALRRGKTLEMLPAVCLTGIFTALAAGAVMISMGHGFEISAHDLILCVIYGAGLLGCGLTVFTLGSRRVPAAELALLSLTEVVLGPVWVWLGVGETPSYMTLIGGTIVLGSLAGLGFYGIRRKPIPIGAV